MHASGWKWGIDVHLLAIVFKEVGHKMNVLSLREAGGTGATAVPALESPSDPLPVYLSRI